MSEFDDFDLGRRLNAAAGDGPDVDTALQSVRRGVVRARRRRMAAVTGAAAVVIVALGLVVTVGNEPSDRITASPGASDSSSTQPDVTAPATSTASTESSTPTSSDSSVPSSSSGSSTSDPRGPATTTTQLPSPLPTSPATALPPSSTATTTTLGDAPADPSTSSTTSTSVPDQTNTTQAPSSSPQTFSSAGGQIVVGVANGQLQLGPITDAAGFTHEVHQQQADDVEVRFTSADAEWRIRVRLIDGQMRDEITPN